MKFLRALCILLFIVSPAAADGPVWGIATTSTPGVVQPDNSTVTITSKGVISASGGGGGGTGIQTNSGAGNKNTLTNTLFYASGGAGYWLWTNDPTFESGSTILEYPFCGLGNTVTVEFTDGAGNFYGNLSCIPNHSGPTGPNNSYMGMGSSDGIVLNWNIAGTGSTQALQLGANGMPAYAYFNFASNLNSTLSSPSLPLVFRASAKTNGSLLEFDPELVAQWGASNIWQADFKILYDSGKYGNIAGMPDVNAGVVAADFSIGTNGSAHQVTSAKISGWESSVATNTLLINGSAINATGAFTQSGGNVNLFNQQLSISSALVLIGAAGTPATFTVQDGTGGSAHSYWAVDAVDGGTYSAKGGLTLGMVQIATNGLQLDVQGSGMARIPTNAAPFGTISNIVSVTSGGHWTNITKGRELVRGGVISVAAGPALVAGSITANFMFEPSINGALQNTGAPMGGVSLSAIGSNTVWTSVSAELGPGDWFTVSSTLSGAQSANTYHDFYFQTE